jgi:hypothetical protein
MAFRVKYAIVRGSAGTVWAFSSPFLEFVLCESSENRNDFASLGQSEGIYSCETSIVNSGFE